MTDYPTLHLDLNSSKVTVFLLPFCISVTVGFSIMSKTHTLQWVWNGSFFNSADQRKICTSFLFSCYLVYIILYLRCGAISNALHLINIYENLAVQNNLYWSQSKIPSNFYSKVGIKHQSNSTLSWL